MLEPFLPIFLLAGLFYALRHLPAWASAHRRTRRLSQLAEVGWTFEYSRKTVSVYTTALNPLPKACVSSWQRSLQRVYDLGSIAGGIGGGMAIAGGLWALVSVWTAVWAEARLHAMETPVVEEKTVIKRAVQLLTETEFDAKVNTGGLEPLVRCRKESLGTESDRADSRCHSPAVTHPDHPPRSGFEPVAS
jgi:hypothetical protein